ncbi:MAG: hypothetical protein JOZ69_03665, partial [Myxococcales bacterium]|nr:hypothetical protein [Myxococcales bacterium]
MDVLAVVATAGWGCASQSEIHSAQPPSAHFDRYRTVAFDAPSQPPKNYALSPATTEVRQHVGDEAR